MSMISNAELYLASQGRIVRPKRHELFEFMRVEFPNKERSELESDTERMSVLLSDLHIVDMIARKAVDSE